jgi:hypothetical protein
VCICTNFFKEDAVNAKRIFSWFVPIGLAAAFYLPILPAAAASEGTFERTLRVTSPVIIDLSAGAGSVNVRSGNSDEVVVTGRVRVTNWLGRNDEQREKSITADPPIQQSGDQIRIGHPANAGLLHNVSVSYDLIVPAGTRFRSYTGSDSQRLAVASSTAVFLMLIVNVVVFRRNYRSAGRTA